MTSKSLRRLANDIAHLHKHGLPPHFLWPPAHESAHDLSQLTVLLAGPDHTPFAAGLFRLSLRMDAGAYPNVPPTAHFRTKIFHPNVDAASGAVCVDTLKRDWRADLTLRDVLVTIASLLLCPNYASALNAEAGLLLKEDQRAYERRAQLWVRMHAPVPAALAEEVGEAKARSTGEKPTPTVGEGSGVGRVRKRREAMGPGGDSEMRVPNGDGQGGNENAAKATHGGENSTNPMAGRQAPAAALHTPLQHIPQHHTPIQEPRGLGLGVDLDSSTVMDLDTPTAPAPCAPAPRKNARRRYAMLPPSSKAHAAQTANSSSPLPSSISTSSTSTLHPRAHALPSYVPITTSSSSTHPLDPATPEPPSKRRRTDSLSPPAAPVFALAPPRATATYTHQHDDDHPPAGDIFTPEPPPPSVDTFHLSTTDVSHFAPSVTPFVKNTDDIQHIDALADAALGIPSKSAAQAQRYALMKRLVGGDVARYNRAEWAPPRGIFRC